MKAIITNNVSESISGYELIPVLYGKINLDNIPDNSLEEIIAIDFLDHIHANEVDENLIKICNKMRINGIITVRGHELGILSRAVVNNAITSSEYNELIKKTESIHKVSDIVNLIKSKNLSIDTVTIKGMQYEISASRKMQN
jgi:hypothetical protein